MKTEQRMTLLRMAERAVRVNGEAVNPDEVERVFLRYCALVGRGSGDWESSEFMAWAARLEVRPGVRTQAKDLYADFVRWCREHGQRPASMRFWERWMKARYPVVSPANTVNYGVRLAEGE